MRQRPGPARSCCMTPGSCPDYCWTTGPALSLSLLCLPLSLCPGSGNGPARARTGRPDWQRHWTGTASTSCDRRGSRLQSISARARVRWSRDDGDLHPGSAQKTLSLTLSWSESQRNRLTPRVSERCHSDWKYGCGFETETGGGTSGRTPRLHSRSSRTSNPHRPSPGGQSLLCLQPAPSPPALARTSVPQSTS